VGFKVTIDGKSWLTDDLTLDEAERIEQVTHTSWLHIQPFQSAAQCKAILVEFLSRDMDRNAALAKVGALTVAETDKIIEVADDDLPATFVDGMPDPNRAGEPSTG
jgi:hypothetical protein